MKGGYRLIKERCDFTGNETSRLNSLNSLDNLPRYGTLDGPYVRRSRAIFSALKYLLLVLAFVTVLLLVAFRIWLCLPFDQNSETGIEESRNVSCGTCQKDLESSAMESEIKTLVLKESPDDYRLPRDVVPVHYDIRFRAILEPKFIYDCNVTIDLMVLKDTNSIVLNGDLSNVHSIAVIGNDITNRDERKRYETVVLQLAKPLKAGANYTLTMNLTRPFRDDSHGFYKGSFQDVSGNANWFVTTQMEPSYARLLFPCFDEPDFKATFTVTAIYPKSLICLCNMPVNSSIADEEEGYTKGIYHKTPKMSIYLLAFVIGDFKTDNASFAAENKISVYSRPEVVSSLKFANKVGKKFLKIFANKLRIEYNLPKLDFAGIPVFEAGAMENWGLITFNEKYILCHQFYSTVIEQKHVARLVAHEEVHHWFGNLVTMRWWNDLWLNEGFATYFQYIGMIDVLPEWKWEQLFVMDRLHDIFGEDVAGISPPVSPKPEAVVKPGVIKNMFNHYSYTKAGCLIRMMSFVLGEDNFFKGLTNYLKKYSYNNTVQDDLFEELNKVQSKSVINVKEFMDTWTLKSGYPLVTVHYSHLKKKLSLSQKPYLTATTEPEHVEKYRYHIPITYTTTKRQKWVPTTVVWLKEEKITLSVSLGQDECIIVNVKEAGYYRVNYDSINWAKILAQLLKDYKKIHVINRAQILNDVFSLAGRSEISYEFALNISVYLSAETDYIPWRSFIGRIEFLNIMFHKTELAEPWKKFVMKLILPIYKKLKFFEPTHDGKLNDMLRMLIAEEACVRDYKDCLTKSVDHFKKLMKTTDNSNPVQPNFRETIYCAAMHANESKDVHEFIWARLSKERIKIERSKLLSGISCSKSETFLNRALDDCLAETPTVVKRGECRKLFVKIGQHMRNNEMLFPYLKRNWEKIFKLFENDALNYILPASTRWMKLKSDADQILDFGKQYNSTRLEGHVKAIVTKIQSRIKWATKFYTPIKKWLA